MNSLKASGSSIVLPTELREVLLKKISESWSGTVTLNLKEGYIISFEVAEKHRIARETHVSPTNNKKE